MKKDEELAQEYRQQHFPISDYPLVQIDKIWREDDILCISYITAFDRPVGWWHYRQEAKDLIWW